MNHQRSVFDDNAGVSPVIGVILMVAVTVIIAAVIGSTALGLGDEVSETPPQAQFEPEQVDDVTIYPTGGRVGAYSVVEFEHTGGDDVDLSNVDMRVNGKQAYDVFETNTKPAGSPDDCSAPCHYTTTPDETIQAGDTARVAVKQSQSGIQIGDEPRSFTVLDEGEGEYLTIHSDDRTEGSSVSLQDGDEVALVWNSGDTSQTLVEYEVEDPVIERTA